MTTAEPTRIDAFRAKIEQRKACEKKAFDTCMQLIEEDKVDDNILINSAIFIDQERYRGVNEDRSLRQICGYPICSTALPKDIPKHQYHINVKVNQVIDTTERRLFCSPFCYKASKYFERQIPTSPVWAREHQTTNSFKVELLTRETLNKIHDDNSTIISQSTYPRSIPNPSLRRQSSSSSSSSDDDYEKLQLARDEYYKSRSALTQKPTLVETKLKQIALPDHIRTDNTTVDFVITCLYEWITDKTKEYLQNNPTPTTITSINPEKYQQLVNKIDLDDIKSSDGSRGEKKLPTIEELRQTTAEKQYELKVREFYFGKTDTKQEEASASSTIVLPPVDGYSQKSIRVSIVNEKIMTCFRHMITVDFKQSIINDLRTAILELLLTFSYTGENIALKSDEWTIMTLFLIHLLTLKLPILSSHLTESKIIHSLLTTLNLSPDMILHIVKYLLENPLIQTNFQEID